MEFENLPGFRSFYPDACAGRNHVFAQWRQTAKAFNFFEYDAPVLEPLDLYIEKSGEEIVEQLFHFKDRGGRSVAMRPEMTPSLARLIAAQANSLKRPIKWFNIGEHYRYERPQKGRLRAFYQFNADILGESGMAADAELITLLIQTLKSFGLGPDDFTVYLSDRDLWLILLEVEGLNPKSGAQVLSVIDKFESFGREKTARKLTAILGRNAEKLFTRIEEISAIRDFEGLKAYIGDLPIEADLLRRAESRMGEWTRLLEVLNAAGSGECIQVNLGIVRGLAYYTGFVFEAFEAGGKGRALAGGGRYDGLLKKLGGPDMPAVGFGMGDVTLVDLLKSKSLMPDYLQTPRFIVIVSGRDERNAAFASAACLRALGYQVEYPLKDQSFAKQFTSANKSGARFALIYGSEEIGRGFVKVRDLASRDEAELPLDQLPEQVPVLLEFGLKSLKINPV